MTRPEPVFSIGWYVFTWAAGTLTVTRDGHQLDRFPCARREWAVSYARQWLADEGLTP